MAELDIDALPPTCACAVVARSSATGPEFIVGDGRPRFLAARWRRRGVHLDEPARLDEHLLAYCVSGGVQLDVAVDGVRRHVVQQAGAVTFLPAGRPVQWTLEAPGEMVHVHLYIAADALPDMPADALINLRDPWLDGYFRLLVAEVEACRVEGRLDGFDFLDRTGDLVLRRLAELHPRAAHAPPVSSRVSPLRAPIVRRIEAYVEDHLAAAIPLEELAALASMSVDHFVRAFREATGRTPHQWLLERRLDRACALLHQGTDRVAEIARQCGFAGPAHFSSTFHRYHGMTPTQYRRRA